MRQKQCCFATRSTSDPRGLDPFSTTLGRFLALLPPRSVTDLPAGGSRLLQDAVGYVATIVHGEVVRVTTSTPAPAPVDSSAARRSKSSRAMSDPYREIALHLPNRRWRSAAR